MTDAPDVSRTTASVTKPLERMAKPALQQSMPAQAEPPMSDVVYPSPRILEVAGEPRIRQLVLRQYALLMTSPIFVLYTENPWVFTKIAEHVADFIVEACGGAHNYSPHRGNAPLRSRHQDITIDESAREIWLAALYRAMEDVNFPAEVREDYWKWIEAFSMRVVNRRTTAKPLPHISYADARGMFDNRAEGGIPYGLGVPAYSRN